MIETFLLICFWVFVLGLIITFIEEVLRPFIEWILSPITMPICKLAKRVKDWDQRMTALIKTSIKNALRGAR